MWTRRRYISKVGLGEEEEAREMVEIISCKYDSARAFTYKFIGKVMSFFFSLNDWTDSEFCTILQRPRFAPTFLLCSVILPCSIVRPRVLEIVRKR